MSHTEAGDRALASGLICSALNFSAFMALAALPEARNGTHARWSGDAAKMGGGWVDRKWNLPAGG
jgi:hypothetical protein